MPDFIIDSLRGGLNESTPTSLSDDQCEVAMNVEFWRSMLGERRLGSAQIAQTSGWPFGSCERIVWMFRHLPTADPSDAQLWALGIDDTGPTAVLAYKDTAWNVVSMADPLVIDGVSEYQVVGQTLHGKLFIAYPSNVDRMHVWDGTSFRRAGLAEAPIITTVTDTGSGTFTGTRYYRIRWTVQSGGSTLLRSEPGDSFTFTPSGSGSGAQVTMPSLVGADTGITHWELEASVDNANFYIIATTIVATTTITDTQDFSAGYAQDFTLSEDIGDYTVIPSVRFLTVEQDRLMGAGSFVDDELSARVIWTPVFKDPGVGNDERVPIDTDNILDLDVSEGGPLTGLSATVNGYVYVTKFSHIYQLTRTGIRTSAYEAVPLTKARGAVPGSIVEALDQTGNPTLFCLDPDVGPCRIGPRGFEPCGADLIETWGTFNIDATKILARGLYFPEKKQVHWWIPTSSSNIPDLRLVLHTHEMREQNDGMRRGWALWDGPSASALAVCLYADNIDTGAARSNVLKPFIAVEGNGLIWQTDTGDDDNGTDYTATIVTRPFIHGSLLHTFEVQRGALLAEAASGATLDITLIANFGDFEKEVTSIDLTPDGSEEHVMRTLDDLGLAELRSLQIKFEDTSPAGAKWTLEQFAILEDRWQRA
jgi:hypothetical protein